MEGLVATWTIISFAFLFDYFSTLRIRLKRVFSLALVETCFQLWALLTSLGWWEEKVEMRGKVPTSLWLTLWSWTSSFRITWVLVINAECFLPPHPPRPDTHPESLTKVTRRFISTWSLRSTRTFYILCIFSNSSEKWRVLVVLGWEVHVYAEAVTCPFLRKGLHYHSSRFPTSFMCCPWLVLESCEVWLKLAGEFMFPVPHHTMKMSKCLKGEDA